MSLTVTEEALVRQLLDQQAALLSLATSESTIISKLGATKVTLADLTAATVIDDADLLLIRQGTTEKSVSGSVVKALIPDASETVKGIVELATVAEAQAMSDAVRALSPARLASAFGGANQSLAASGYQKLPSGLIIQWGGTGVVTAGTLKTISLPIAFPTAAVSVVATIGSSAPTAASYLTAYFLSLSQINFAINSGSTAGAFIAIGY